MKKTYRENNKEALIDCKFIAMIWRNTELYSAKVRRPLKIAVLSCISRKYLRI